MARAVHFTLRRPSHTKVPGPMIGDTVMACKATGVETVIRVTSKTARGKATATTTSRMGTATVASGNTISRTAKVGISMRMAADMKVCGSETLNMAKALITSSPVIITRALG